MTITNTAHDAGNRRRFNRTALACAAALAGVCGSAHAMSFNAGGGDIVIRFDNALRYNLGMRVDDIDDRFGKSDTYDETEYAFDKGDIVTNRLDLLSEFDFTYRGRHGLRFSGSAWYDAAYDDDVETHPGEYAPGVPYSSIGAYVDNRYSHTTERFYQGPSAELLDAFAFTTLDLGSLQLNLRAGKHTVFWGESLFTTSHGISYSQAPLDGLKASASPGIEAKEVFMPIAQVSAQLQVSDTVSVAGQYYLDWRANRLPQGGTYFGAADMLFSGPERLFVGLNGTTPLFAPHGPSVEPDHDYGSWGLNLRWSPAWADGTIGLYAREFDEMQPWGVVLAVAPPSPLPVNYHQAYAQNTRLYGISYATTIGVVSVGSEFSVRKNTALNSKSSFAAAGDFAGKEGARGDTFHALLNGIYILPRTPLWVGGTLQGELIYSKLDSVTRNDAVFNRCTPGQNTDTGCSTDDVVLSQIGFTAEWPQALAGIDLSMPTSFSYGIHGNGPTLSGGNEGSYTYSIGLGAKYRTVNEFVLRFNDTRSPFVTNANNVVTAVSGNAAQNSHGWLSFTFKRTF